MLTEKDYCDYDTWSALKELGCDIPRRLIPDYFGVLHEPQFEETLHLYDAQKWLRDEKRIHIVLTYYSQMGWYEYSVKEDDNLFAAGSVFPTYEEALSTAIYMAVKYLKEEK